MCMKGRCGGPHTLSWHQVPLRAGSGSERSLRVPSSVTISFESSMQKSDEMFKRECLNILVMNFVVVPLMILTPHWVICDLSLLVGCLIFAVVDDILEGSLLSLLDKGINDAFDMFDVLGDT